MELIKFEINNKYFKDDLICLEFSYHDIVIKKEGIEYSFLPKIDDTIVYSKINRQYLNNDSEFLFRYENSYVTLSLDELLSLKGIKSELNKLIVDYENFNPDSYMTQLVNMMYDFEIKPESIVSSETYISENKFDGTELLKEIEKENNIKYLKKKIDQSLTQRNEIAFMEYTDLLQQVQNW